MEKKKKINKNQQKLLNFTFPPFLLQKENQFRKRIPQDLFRCPESLAYEITLFTLVQGRSLWLANLFLRFFVLLPKFGVIARLVQEQYR